MVMGRRCTYFDFRLYVPVRIFLIWNKLEETNDHHFRLCKKNYSQQKPIHPFALHGRKSNKLHNDPYRMAFHLDVNFFEKYKCKCLVAVKLAMECSGTGPESKHLIKNELRENNKKKSQPIDDCRLLAVWIERFCTIGVNARRVNCCAPRLNNDFVHYMLLAMRFSTMGNGFRFTFGATFLWQILLFAHRYTINPIACNSSETKKKTKDAKQSKFMPCDTTCNESSKCGMAKQTIIVINTKDHSCVLHLKLSLRLQADS